MIITTIPTKPMIGKLSKDKIYSMLPPCMLLISIVVTSLMHLFHMVKSKFNYFLGDSMRLPSYRRDSMR
jgi:hypothetical protein